MNINEDKFLNKSAEEIVKDMLLAHENDATEALAHTQELLQSNDGLSLPQQIKDELAKAADMLSDTVKNENAIHDYKVKLYTEGKVYTCYVGNLPIALTLAEQSIDNQGYNKAEVLKENKIICSYNHDLKEWVLPLQEDIKTTNDLTQKSFVDLNKDISDIDERIKLELCGLHPGLADKRKPKWSNPFANKSQIIPLRRNPDMTGEILFALDGIENKINKENPDQTKVIVREKIPVDATEKGMVYEDGEPFVLTVKDFKDIINAPENAGILAKFEKSHEESPEYMLNLDLLAKKNMDDLYPQWEQNHWDKYNLDLYTMPEKSDIYQAWKHRNTDTMYQKARELTPEEVNTRFGIPRLLHILNNKKDTKRVTQPLTRILNTIIPSEKEKLTKELFDKLLDYNNNDNPNDLLELAVLYGARNQINQIAKGKLFKFENDLNNSEEFNNQLNSLIKSKYINPKNNLPQLVGKEKEVIEDLNNLFNQFQSTTQTSAWNQEVASAKKISELMSEVSDGINQINELNPETGKQVELEFNGYKNKWKTNNITGDELEKELVEFLYYIDTVIDNEGNPVNINQGHEDWLEGVKRIINPKAKPEQRSNGLYDAIVNKISRINNKDPEKGKGYGNLFRTTLEKLEQTYPNPYDPRLSEELVKFLETLKKETKSPSTVSKSLEQYI